MKKILLLIFLLTITYNLQSQDLLDILDEETEGTTTTVSATFKGTRIANGHSVENRKAKELEFIIGHRFGALNSGTFNLFGLDNANIRFSLEYGITDDLMIGIGRSSLNKLYDSFLKYKLLKQKTGKNAFPFSVSVFGSVVARDYPENDKRAFAETLSYTSQLLIARKFSPSVSLQITPTYIHKNTVELLADPHDYVALGLGGRVKLSKRVALNAEYFYNFDELTAYEPKNPIAFGVDIETGGHVFQLIISNARAMIEPSFITETAGDFLKGDIHFGFNISRTF
jgi:hypothetical protein